VNDDRRLEEKLRRLSWPVDRGDGWAGIEAQARKEGWTPDTHRPVETRAEEQIGDSARTNLPKVPTFRVSTTKRRSTLRVAVLASLVVILAAGITAGSLEAVKYLGKEHRTLVFGDDPASTSPGLTGSATATTAVSVQTTIPATPSTAASPPTTDSPYPLETRLPNGHFRGLVLVVYMQSLGSYRSIRVDYLEMLTGEEAKAAAAEDGAISPGEDLPNGYYIRNLTTPEEEGLEGATKGENMPGFVVDETASITTYTFGDGGEQTITWEQFFSFWNPVSPPEGGERMRNVPWWIERDEQGNVVSITEFNGP
jgi:hypothetical protein